MVHKNYIWKPILALLLMLPVIGYSQQAGDLDRGFNYGRGEDYLFNYGYGPVGNLFTSAVLPDGKILIGGDFSSYNGISCRRIARLNSDGSLDNTFSVGDGPNNYVYSLAVQTDGKIVIGGAFTTVNGTSANRIARLNTDGSLDNTFNSGGTGAGSQINCLSIQPDGKILIGGNFSTYNGTARNRVARLNSDGSLDNFFSVGTGANNPVQCITFRSDGKVLIGGDFTSYNSTSINRIARLNANGALDNTFNISGTGANGIVSALVSQSDGKVLIGGAFTTFNGTNSNRITRLNEDGSLDASFSNSGIGASASVSSLVVQSDGKIVIGGDFTSYNSNPVIRIARLNTDGGLDNSFNLGSGASGLIRTIALQSNGKMVIGGDFTTYNNANRKYNTRLNADGSLDNAYNPNTGTGNLINTFVVQPNGKIIIGGLFREYNGTSQNFITRLNADGSLDNSFNVGGSGANNNINTIALQDDGKIVIGGTFTSYNTVTTNRIARLNADGSLDNSFNVGGSGVGSSGVSSIVIQTDGKILIGGGFTTYNGSTANRITRLNTNGTLDNTFNNGAVGANNFVNTIALQLDGKILIGGDFTDYNGSNNLNRILRLNADGSIDGSFNPGNGTNGAVVTIAIQTDGKILIGGGFSEYNGFGYLRIARLNTNGIRDNTFSPGTGIDGRNMNPRLFSIALQPDGKILIGGAFLTYNNV